MKGHLRHGRSRGQWYLRVELSRDASGKRRQHREAYRGTKREAETRLRELLRLAESDGIDVARLTFVELVLGKIKASNACGDECARDLHEKHRDGGWLNATKTRVGRRTWLRYRQIVKQYLVAALGELRVDKLKPAHIEGAIANWSSGALIKRTEKPLSPRSVRHLRDTMRAACRWGLRMELMSRDVTAAVEPPKVEQKEMQTLDAAGVAALLTAAEGSELQAPIAVLVGTGLRRGELLGLRWTDLDLDGGRLSVRRSIELVDGQRREKPPKTTRSARTLSLAAFVVDTLRRQKKEQLERFRVSLADDLAARRCQEAAYVFDRADGSLWKPDSFSWSFAALIRRAKLPKVRLHDLRHSHATLSLAAGADLKTISTALGHSTIAITANTYIHAIEAMQRAHADRLEAVLGRVVASAIGEKAGPIAATSVPQRCHATPRTTKNARKIRRFEIAPAGFEPALLP
jgi:integrase